jgi:hypothetical protein
MNAYSLKTLTMFAVLALLFASVPTAYAQQVRETLIDRCSGDVIIVRNYNDSLDAPGNIYLTRDRNTDANGYTDWKPIAVNGRTVRWYCHSRSWGRWLDPGTWRIQEAGIVLDCDEQGNCTTKLKFKPGSSAVNGWYPERSRCARGEVRYARLGPNRLLQMACM